MVAMTMDDKLGPLLEEVAAVIGLEHELGADGLGELLHHLRADVLVREDRGEAQGLRILAQRRKRQTAGQRCGKKHTAGNRE